MGSVHVHLDLSHANEVHQNHLLANEIREHGRIPGNHFWQTVYWNYYRNDIAQTGNDLRFRSHHRWVDDQFRHYDRHFRLGFHQLAADSGVPSIPLGEIPQSILPPPSSSQTNPASQPPGSQTVTTAGVPEPSGVVLLAIGLILAWWGCRRHRRGIGTPLRSRYAPARA